MRQDPWGARCRHGRGGGSARVLAMAGFMAGAALAGCGLFGGETSAPDPASAPFAAGVLKEAANRAPAGSVSQFLGTLADELGWEADVNQDVPLRRAIEEGDFEERVEPRLLALFFRKGFSILPTVGEGHEFTRDSLVRGPVANSRFLVRAPGAVRIIFLDQVDNIVIIYPKNREQPQVFNRIPRSTVALRESRLEQYLN